MNGYDTQAMLKIHVVPVTPFAQNCSIIMCTQTNVAAVVDPGGDIERIMHAVRQMNATVEQILLTHGHLDHAAGAPALAATEEYVKRVALLGRGNRHHRGANYLLGFAALGDRPIPLGPEHAQLWRGFRGAHCAVVATSA